MAKINLLPWRAELRKQRQRDFGVAAGISVLITGLLMAALHMHINGLIENQISRNSFLNEEILIVEGKIKQIEELTKKKEQIVARMRVIERLQRNRPEVVHLFDELAKSIPDGLYLNKTTQQGRDLHIDGFAESNARVSAFMRNLDASDWLKQPVLDVISSGAGSAERIKTFSLRLKQTSPFDEEGGVEE